MNSPNLSPSRNFSLFWRRPFIFQGCFPALCTIQLLLKKICASTSKMFENRKTHGKLLSSNREMKENGHNLLSLPSAAAVPLPQEQCWEISKKSCQGKFVSKKPVKMYKYPLYLQPPGVPHSFTNLESVFIKSLSILAEFSLVVCVLLFQPKVSKFSHVVSPYKWLSLSRFHASCLSCNLSF